MGHLWLAPGKCLHYTKAGISTLYGDTDCHFVPFMTHSIYNFFELSNHFTLKPEAAIQHFTSKGLKASFSWMDMIGEENDAAFTVAKMMDNDLLAFVEKETTKAIDAGLTLADYKKELIPRLQKAGWWGKKDVIDPLTGQVTKAQLGSASRLENIFRTNLQSAYAVGQWQSIEDNKNTAPFLMYDAVEDHRVRPEHLQWNGTVREVDDPFWQTHYPPNGWQCRCGVIQLDREELKEHHLRVSPKPKIKKRNWTNPRTGKIHKVSEGLDPGWDHNPGKRRMDYLRQLKKEKDAQLSIAQQKANKVSDQAIQKAQQAFTTQLAANKALKKLGQTETEGAFKRQKEKALEKSAQHQLDTAIAENTPYLASAIKQLNKQKGTAGLTAKELMDKAKAKAGKIEQSVLLNQYKKAKVNGKTPNQKAQAIYDDLPETAQKAIDDAIELKTGQYQARETLKNIKDNPKGQTLKHQILKKLEQAGEADTLTPTQLLKKVEDTYLIEQKKKEVAAKLSGYKKKILDGKLPTPAQQAAFDTLDDAAKQKFLAKVDAAKKTSLIDPGQVTSNKKTSPETSVVEPKAEAPEWKNLTKIGNQKGSNPGGFYQDTTTGKKYYIKEPASEDIARNEVLAGKLYDALGVDVPNLYLMKDGKAVRIASEIVDDLKQDGSLLQSGKISGINENLMVDAWLANWDVTGLGYDNLLIKGSKAIHVDVGGALRYRAQGGLKGEAFAKQVLEIESLRDPGMNPQSAAVFANVTQDDLTTGARKVLSLDKQQIQELVDRFGPTTQRERTKLVNTLVARQKDIAKRYPEAVKAPEATPLKGEAVTRLEYEQVKNSRSNGYAIATDKGDIEDHNVLLYQKKNLDGEDVTAAYFKLRPAAMRKLQRSIGDIAEEGADPAKSLHPLMIKAIKAIAHRADLGNGLDDYVFGYIDNAVVKFAEVRDQLYDEVAKGYRSKGELVDFENKLMPFIHQLEEVQNKFSPGEVPTWDKSVGVYKAFEVKPATRTKETTAIQWTRKKTKFNLAQFDRGYQRHSKIKFDIETEHLEAEIDGVVVKYWPADSKSLQSMKGRVEIEVDGLKQADTAKVFDTINTLGINSQRATPLDIEELYLDKLAYIHRIDKQLKDASKGMTDQSQRIAYKKAEISKDTGIQLEGNPHYNPAGSHQAFGHGRRVHFRPELMNHPRFKEFENDMRLVHRNTDNGKMSDTIKAVLSSGGQMASTTDKIRRGIEPGGMSYRADMRSGGANYFFTRLQKKHSAYHGEQFVWKVRQATRMDAISYNRDTYGRTTGNHVQQNRKTEMDDLMSMHTYDSNETIFKDSLSLFDDLDRIVVRSKNERQTILSIFKEAGYDQWPDGRSLEDIVKLSGED